MPEISKNQDGQNGIETMIQTGSVVVASSKVVVGPLLVVVGSVEANLAASASSASWNELPGWSR